MRRTALLLAAALALLAGTSFGATIYLKDGKKIEG